MSSPLDTVPAERREPLAPDLSPDLHRVPLAAALAAPAPGWTVTTDAVVVGSGVAGLVAALRLRRRGARVVLVTKGGLVSGSTVLAQGGIAAALDPSDSPEAHRADTLAAGGGLCDGDAVDVLCREGPARVRELATAGARFDLAAHGGLALTREGGHHADRIVHAGGDATGVEVSRALVEQAVLESGIEVIEHALVLDLLTGPTADDGAPGPVRGVTVHVIGEGSRDGVGAVLAPAVVLATGGIGRLYPSSTNPAEATGDGLAAAVRAGAAVADVEFVQFHPTVLWLGAGVKGRLALVSEAVRGEGAVLLDSCGTRFMPAVHPLAELAPRDVVAHAIVRQMARTGTDHVLLDARHRGPEFLRRRFPTIHERLMAEGIDLATDLVPVAPAQHYHSGGIVTDLRGRTSVPGLWAAGEVACTGVHGANRLASNSLLEGLVFGHRAADDVADHLGPVRHPDPVERSGTSALVPAAVRPRIQKLAASGPGVIRSAAGLAAAAQGLAAVPTRPGSGVVVAPQVAEWETTNLHQVAVLLTEASALRTESRGGHFREDHPEPDESWTARLVGRRTPDGLLTWHPTPT